MDHSNSKAQNQLQYDSSMEELSLEAKLLLASTKRQDPQGEEHTNLPPSSPCVLNYSTSSASNPPALQQSNNSSSSNRNLSAQKYNSSNNGQGAKRSNSGSPRESSTTTSQSSDSSYSEDEEQDIKSSSKGLRPNPKPVERQRASSAAPSQKCISKVQQQHAGHYGHGQPIARAKGLPTNISTDSGNSAYNTLIIHQNNSSLLADTWIPASHEFTSMSMGPNNNGHTHSNSMGVLPNYSMAVAPHPPQPLPRNMAHYDPTGTGRVQPYSNPYENIHLFGAVGGGVGTSSEISEIPRDYLNQLTVLKHLAKEVHQQDPVSGTGSSLLRSSSFSKSQPDLTQAGPSSRVSQDPNYTNNTSKPQPQEPRRSRSKQTGSGNNDKSPTTSAQLQPPDVMPSVQILELLMRENAVLNAELVKARIKIQTIHKLESELDRLQAQHSALFESAERRESLERTARAKLSTELNRVKKVNRELMSSSGSIQNLSGSGSGSSGSGDVEGLKKELSNKDILITQLLSQNKELQSIKERQEIELTAQRATLAEQRTHIDILDSALTNAQASVLRLEEDVRKKQEIVDKSSQLQRALSSLQITNDKREENERAARSQLEDEISDLKLRLASINANGPTSRQTPSRSYQSPPPYGASHQSPQTSRFDINENAQHQMNYLQEKLKVSEDQIHHLNSQVARWENVFDYQQQRKQSTGSTTITTPNTPNSRSGTPHFFPSCSEKIGSGSDSHSTELEWKIKDLETRLVERDAMIRALRGPITGGGSNMLNYRESPSYSQASTASYGHHHRQTSASAGTALYSQTVSDELPNYANIRMRLGGSGSSLVNNTNNNSKKNSNESLQMQGAGTGSSGSLASGTNSKSIEEQLKDLDSQLLTKSNVGGGGSGAGLPGTLKIQSGLCCIPGFPNSALTKGKGNLASLNAQAAMLAGVGAGGNRKSSYYLPPKPIPKPPPSTYQTQNHGSSGTGRAGSGPPFINHQSSQSQQANSSSVITPLSNSVDSGLSDSVSKSGVESHKDISGSNVFSPASISSLPKGLPPRPDSGGPSTRSLERNRPLPNELVGKYTVITNRCRSLDRRELKKAAEEKQEIPTKKAEKELKGNLKSKAAFFGQLLSRRSPSPSREKSDKDKEPSTPKSSRRFPFGKSSSESKTSVAPPPTSEDVETIILEKQGRQSQSQRSNRISSKWTSTQALEVVEEAQSGAESTTASPWIQRKSKESQAEQSQSQQISNENDESSIPADKKWGRIVKTPFGLRYTFGSPRVASSVPLDK